MKDGIICSQHSQRAAKKIMQYLLVPPNNGRGSAELACGVQLRGSSQSMQATPSMHPPSMPLKI